MENDFFNFECSHDETLCESHGSQNKNNEEKTNKYINIVPKFLLKCKLWMEIKTALF